MPCNLPMTTTEFVGLYLKLKPVISQSDDEEIIKDLNNSFQLFSGEKREREFEGFYNIALVLAVEKNKTSVVEALLERKELKNINDVFQVDNLHAGPPLISLFLYSNKFIVNSYYPRTTYRTLLGHAAFQGQFEMVEYLIKRGADVNVVVTISEDYQKKILEEQVGQDKIPMVGYCFNQSMLGKAPLHEVVLGDRYRKEKVDPFGFPSGLRNYEVAENNSEKIAKYLLQNGADLKIKDNSNNTPCDYCYSNGIWGSDLFSSLVSKKIGRTFHRHNQYLNNKARVEDSIDSFFLFHYKHKEDSGYTKDVVKIMVDYLEEQDIWRAYTY